MNITLSVDDDTVERVRELARLRNTSLNQLVRDYLDDLAGKGARVTALKALERLWSEPAGNSLGRTFSREGTYAEPARDRSLRRPFSTTTCCSTPKTTRGR